MSKLFNMEPKIVSDPQLIVKRCNSSNASFIHCLICSTAPKNAENKLREDLQPIDLDNSLASLAEIKQALQQFIKAHWDRSGENVLDKIRIVLDIHGFNVPLVSLEKNSYEPLVKKFKSDSKDQTFDDFVLFINFSWPSERVIFSQIYDWFLAMPLILWVLLIGAIALASLVWTHLLYPLGLILVGLTLALILLRLAVYFRDRDRASNYGVFDAVELVRWIHRILEEILIEQTVAAPEISYLKSNPAFFGTVSLSFIAHSMGCFVATQTIRVLSDVFDPAASNHWKETTAGPFGGMKVVAPVVADGITDLQKIGNFFRLKSLILASPDIPIWAITTGRANFLRTCLRRFEEAYLFTNDADMVLRLASTVANYFIFPSNSRIGGYRLGNLTCTGTRLYGEVKLDATGLGIRAFSKNLNLADKPFASLAAGVYQSFTVVDCTDYQDVPVTGVGKSQRWLSFLTANNSSSNSLNYFLTACCHFLGIGRIDSHGGYFRGKFCLDLLYALALYGENSAREKCREKYKLEWHQLFQQHQIAWIQTKHSKNVSP